MSTKNKCSKRPKTVVVCRHQRAGTTVRSHRRRKPC